MISALRSEKASKNTLTQFDNLVSRKSDAKLQPLPKLTKYFPNYFLKITFFNTFRAFILYIIMWGDQNEGAPHDENCRK